MLRHQAKVFQLSKKEIKVYVPLTKKRHELLKAARELMPDKFLFCYADGKYHLKSKWKDKSTIILLNL